MASSMGGGVMRTAASRLVGVGSVISGVGGVIRRLLSIPKLEYQLLAAARRPASAIAASTEGGPAVAEKTSWEVGDTECASLEDDVGSGSSNSPSLPRVVFVGDPTFDEAKEASMELKEAVEKTLTPENTSLPLVMASEDAEATTCVSSDIASTLVVRKHVVQAFRILSENPAAQNVVASIASDPNVWNAVFQNAELVNYVESHRTGATSSDTDARLNQHIGIVELQDLNFSAESENSSVGSSVTNEIGTSIAEILQTIKLKVMDIVNNVSNFFQDIFGVPETDKKPSDDASFLGATSPDIDADLNQHIGIVKLQDLNFFAKSENSSVGSSETHEIGTSISEILQTIKLTVIDIVNNVSNFIQDIFGVPETYKKPSYDASFSKASFIESTSLKASIRGLAIVVLSMAVLKRV